jgi:hypothetical protein
VSFAYGNRVTSSAGWPFRKADERGARLTSDIELIDAYRKAAHHYDAAKTGTGDLVKAFTSLS